MPTRTLTDGTSRKTVFLLHPFLFALFPVLFLYSHNIEQTWFSEILPSVAVALSSVLLLVLSLRLLIQDTNKAGIIVSLFLIHFFSYGHIFNALLGASQIGHGKQRYLLAAFGLTLIASAYFIVRTRKNLGDFTRILNIAATSVVLIPLINVTVYQFRTSHTSPDVKALVELETPKKSPKAADLPDIYYIILDRYASQSVLQEIYGFDNTEFTNYLSSAGFYVAHESSSNYLKTAHSLASSLNMKYINDLGELLGPDFDGWKPIYRMLQNYEVLRFLKSRGYRIIHFGSWWQPTSRNEYADMNFNVPLSLTTLPEFSMFLLHTTALSPFASWSGFFDRRREQWTRVPYKFSKLAEIPNIEGPTFVFAHMLIPHGPYVFDKNGDFQTEEEEGSKDRAANYLDQLVFVNKKVRTLIDTLLTTSKAPPIIILQADEGPFPQRYVDQTVNFDWSKATDTELRQKTRILNAYYFPDSDKDALYPSITPVNSFRVLFNVYFNAEFELLPDECYAFQDEKHPYQFFNVTDKVSYN